MIKRIDANRGQLGKEDAKFYSVIFFPSEKELMHLSQRKPEKQAEKLRAFVRSEGMVGIMPPDSEKGLQGTICCILARSIRNVETWARITSCMCI